MPVPNDHNELRCFCPRKPLLATYGLNSKGKLYVHIKVFKQARIFGEVICYGPVQVRCRECLRWHTIVIRQNVPHLIPVPETDGTPVDEPRAVGSLPPVGIHD